MVGGLCIDFSENRSRNIQGAQKVETNVDARAEAQRNLTVSFLASGAKRGKHPPRGGKGQLRRKANSPTVSL